MTDTQAASPPGFIKAMAASAARHAFTGIGGVLIARGVFTNAQEGEFVDVGVALVLYGFSMWWSAIQKRDSIDAAATSVMKGIP